MLDLFTIFSKSGIVLWYFQGTSGLFTNTVNELIKSVILQERAVQSAWNHNTLSLQYKLDNEFELVFVVAYQNILKLTYVDKFLTEIQLRFRDKYKQAIQNCQFGTNFDGFKQDFDEILECCEREAEQEAQVQRKPRKYEESEKSTRTVASMMETKKTFLGNLIQSATGSDKPKTEEVENLTPDLVENVEGKQVNSPGPRQMRRYEPKS
ncbi:signal recognition particle receptor subunit alpha [Brachionus plicatilis]|uniref:Signal recognition particle receptor subunit alpha n=1 Tax=Brachionus plicatilis TaxID=10195 RepID=A0A3M7PEL4_BRAPC|nr:signal recognition particle receptor subunit alpha [Brachionus plicatilis]